MPIYEYVCSACGRRIDVIHGVYAAGPTACEVCGGAMRKALTAPAIHFKGSGWAKKDARASAPAASSAPTTDAAGAAEGGAEKPAAAKDAPAKDGPAKDAPAKDAPAPAASPAATPAPGGAGD
jgi:putative FmdB family regulatory protein